MHRQSWHVQQISFHDNQHFRNCRPPYRQLFLYTNFIINHHHLVSWYDRLTPTGHVTKLLKKVATNTRLLLEVQHLMNSHLSLKFYHHFIHSYLTYGPEIYFPLATSKQTTSLTVLQRKALKYALSLPRCYPTRLLEHSSVLLLPKLAC